MKKYIQITLTQAEKDLLKSVYDDLTKQLRSQGVHIKHTYELIVQEMIALSMIDSRMVGGRLVKWNRVNRVNCWVVEGRLGLWQYPDRSYRVEDDNTLLNGPFFRDGDLFRSLIAGSVSLDQYWNGEATKE